MLSLGTLLQVSGPRLPCLQSGYQGIAKFQEIPCMQGFGTALAHNRHSRHPWKPWELGDLAEFPTVYPGSRERTEPRLCPATSSGGFLAPFGCQAPDGCWAPSQGKHLANPRGTSMQHLARGGGSSPPSGECLLTRGCRGSGSLGRQLWF